MTFGAPPDAPTTASEWALRLNNGSLSEPEQEAFARWLASGKGRAREVEEARAVLRVAGALKDSPIARAQLTQGLHTVGAASPSAAQSNFRARRAWIAGAGSLAAGGLLTAIFLPRGTPTTPVLDDHAEVSTAVGSVERFRLPDRSSLTVGARSSVQLAFSHAEREVSLHQGKAFFEVTRNVRRPFIVTAGSHEVMATGTKFNASYNQAKDQLEVAVLEGTVDVGRAGRASTRANQRIAAGSVTLFSARRAGISRNLTPIQAAAWRSGDLYFDDAELDDVLLDVNGYLPKPLVLTGSGMAHLTLAAQLPAGDTHAALFVLREVLGIDAREHADRWELFKATG